MDFTKFEKSPAWKQATAAINSVVDDYNRQGKRMTAAERNCLNELRILITILKDKEVFTEFSESIWNQLKKEEAKQ